MARGKQSGTAPFRPFADDDEVVTIGGFTIENGADRVSLSGSLDLTKNKFGLEKAQTLKGAVDAIVAALEGASDLPDEAVEETKPAKTVKNPFE